MSKKTKPVDVRPFCSKNKDVGRAYDWNLTQPRFIGARWYATDGHIAIRRWGLASEYQQRPSGKFPQIDKVRWWSNHRALSPLVQHPPERWAYGWKGSKRVRLLYYQILGIWIWSHYWQLIRRLPDVRIARGPRQVGSHHKQNILYASFRCGQVCVMGLADDC